MPYIQVNDIKMYFKIFNNGKETENLDSTSLTMIVLHGGPGIVDHQIEVNAWTKFSPPLQVIFPDQRGCGLTEDGVPNKWNLTQCGEDIFAFSQALGLKQPIIASTSWSSYVVLSYLHRHADHPKALIFFDAEAKFELNVMQQAYDKIGHTTEGKIALEYYQNPEDQALFEKWIHACVPLFSQKPFSFHPPTRTNLPMRIKFMKEELLQFDFREVLRQVQCPILWLAGERSPTHPAMGAATAVSYIPDNFRNFVIIKNSGSPVWNDQPEIFRETVNNFLNTLCCSEPSHLCDG